MIVMMVMMMEVNLVSSSKGVTGRFCRARRGNYWGFWPGDGLLTTMHEVQHS